MTRRSDLAPTSALASTATRALARWSWLAALALALCALAACGDDGAASDDGGSGTAGQGEACSTNDDCASGLRCVAQACQSTSTTGGTTSTNGGTTSTNSGTTSTNGGTTSTNSGTTSTNGGTTTPPADAGNNDPNDVGTPDAQDDVAPDAPDEDAGAPRPARLVGGVSLFEVDVTAGFLFSLERGNFGAAFTEPQTEAAPVATFGACDVIRVSTAEVPAPFGYDAGTITISGGNVNYTLPPSTATNGSVSYSSGLSDDNEDAYPPDTPLQISASGGAHIGPFSGAVTTPGEHSMSAPAADARVGSGALEITWGPANTTHAVLISAVPLDSFFGAVNGNGLSCAVPADTGSFTVPAEAMAMLSGPRLAITVIKASNTTVNVGPDELILNVTYAAGNVVQK